MGQNDKKKKKTFKNYKKIVLTTMSNPLLIFALISTRNAAVSIVTPTFAIHTSRCEFKKG